MRAELIGHFKACMTDIYLHIDARMADYIRTHPYAHAGVSVLALVDLINREFAACVRALALVVNDPQLAAQYCMEGIPGRLLGR